MLIKNTKTQFGLIAILFHWIITILILGMICVGLYMVPLPNSLEKLKLYGMHKETGILVLALVSMRILWRVSNITPALAIPLWEKLIARLVHWAFYGFMFAMPITGWMMSSAFGVSVSFFGLFTLPNLVSPDPLLGEQLKQLHHWLAYALIGLIILHTAAAFKHHFIDKDDVLKRMLSTR